MCRRRGSQGAHQLVCQHEHSLETELAVAEVEEVLQAGTQQVQDHDIVVTFHAIPPHVWDASCMHSQRP